MLLGAAMIASADAAARELDVRGPDERRAVLAALPMHWLAAADRRARERPMTAELWRNEARERLAPAADPRERDSGNIFARLARTEDGIAAAINAYVGAADTVSAAMALDLLVRGLRVSGQDYAARTMVPPTGARGRATSPRMLDTLDSPPASRELGRWTVHCDLQYHCTAVLRHGDAPVLVMERAAGPGTPLVARIVLPGAAAIDTALTLQLGRRRQAMPPYAAGAALDRPIPPSLLDPLVERIAAGLEIKVSVPARDRQWQLPTTGGSEVLEQIDRLQQRAGHSSALLLRGRAAESRVPLAPQPREVQVRRATVLTMDGDVPPDMRDFWHHSCSEASLIQRLPDGVSTRIAHLRLGDDTELWLLPCRSGAYGMQSMAAFRVDGNLQALTHPYRHNGIEPRPLLLERAGFAFMPESAIGAAVDPSAARVSVSTATGQTGLLFLNGREMGQPPSCTSRWVWNGRWLDRVEETCSGSPGTVRVEIVTRRDRILVGN